jgi:hypothetical protein
MRMIGIGTALAAFLAAAPVVAVEPDAFLERLRAAYELMGYDFAFGPARAEGDAIIVDGASVAITQPEGMLGPVDLDVELRFSGVAEREDGTYTADALTIDEITFSQDIDAGILAFLVEDIRMTDFYLPAGEPTAADSVMLFSDLDTGPLSVTHDGMEVLRIGAITADSTFNPSPGEGEIIDLSSRLAFEEVTIHTGPGKEAKTGRAILGAPEINGTLEGTITWSMADGRVALDPLTIAFDDQGKLELAFTFDGMTADVLQTIYETDRRAAEMMSKGKTQSASELQIQAGLELLEKLQLVGAHVRYDDAGLAPRLLTYSAKHEGQEPDVYAEDLVGRVEGLLANTRAPELTQSIVSEVRRFVADPQSIEAAVAPAAPLKLITAVSAAVSPAGMAKMLNLSVTANGAAQAGDDAVR